MTIEEFLDRHDAVHNAPMNVIDMDTGHRDVPLLVLPDCIRQISLVDRLERIGWVVPRDMDPRRGISSYLLLGERNCLTDFHQDFSGTSVFYFVLKGKKTFYLVRPSENNLKRLDQWSEQDEKKGSLFFGEMPLDDGGCVQVKLTIKIKIL